MGTARAPDPPYLPDVDAFEAGAIEAERFDHAAHLHVAWRYLEHYPLADAIVRFTAALRALTLRLGAEGKYHETISWFFMILVADRAADDPACDWLGIQAPKCRSLQRRRAAEALLLR